MKNSYRTYGGQIAKNDLPDFPDDILAGGAPSSFKVASSYKNAYVQPGSGFWSGYNGLDISRQYAALPEEYTIFSSLDGSVLELANANQRRFILMCLQYMRSQLIALTQFGVIRILPKLSTTVDQDNAIILNWVNTNFRIYFSFEQFIENSYYGVIAQDSYRNISTNTGLLNEENYSSVIDLILSYVINNS